jgi:ribonuclease BN (tRNA processing enzyme)
MSSLRRFRDCAAAACVGAAALLTSVSAPIPVRASDVSAVPAAPIQGTRLILLGTGGGPMPRKLRSQPANLLIVNGAPYLIDAGNGVARQLALAGLTPAEVRTIFITHHHIDHNADLGALIAFTWMEDSTGTAQTSTPVQIYGPPSTTYLVGVALDYLSVSERIFRSEIPMAPTANRFIGHDITAGGLVYQDANVRVTAVENSHFHIPPSAPDFGKDKSFSYRFDTADRSVVFTGDTGPCEALTELATGADVLVSEVIDLDATMNIMTHRAQIPPDRLAAMRFHMSQEHLTPEAIGQMAAKAHVKTVILTHFVPGLDNETDPTGYVAGVRKYFSGTVIAGQDLLEY